MKVINKGGTDETVIMAVRQGIVQPMLAGAWLDLRVAFFMSVCGSADPASDDVITGLGETISDPGPGLPPTAYSWIGLKDNSTIFPGLNNSVFIGYSNYRSRPFGGGLGDSVLVTSDLITGTTNADYWRPKNSISDAETFKIMDGGVALANGSLLCQHFVQNYSGGHAAGYATLLMIRLTRPSSTSTLITATMKQGTSSTDVLFSSTPTLALLESNMESYPSTVQQLGPLTMSAVPDCLFWFWPFHNSRLRIHCAGFEVIAS